MGSGTVEISRHVWTTAGWTSTATVSSSAARYCPPTWGVRRRSPRSPGALPARPVDGRLPGALPILLGEEATGLSTTTITRLTNLWSGEYDAFSKRSLADRDFVYVWADGVHFRIRLEDERLCTLVLVGVRPDGTKEMIAVVDGYRESGESWGDLLRDLKKRGMQAPAVAVGDGALGFWAAVGDVWPETKEQRCWVHRVANVLDKLPKSLQPKAKKTPHEIMAAPTRAAAETAMGDFREVFKAKYPKAVASLATDLARLLTIYNFPAEHWVHLRTTNPIESTFATVRLRQRVTKGAGSRPKGLTMAYKLLYIAQSRWRKVTAPHLVPLVRAGVVFKDGVKVERCADPTPSDAKDAA